MIYFYNIKILYLLPLSFLPVILHLLSLRKTKKIKFTYVYLLEKIVKQQLAKKRIVDILVLILRCLIIAVIILFFSRPVMYVNPAKESITNIIVMLDNSFSMSQKIGDVSKLELCKKFIVDLLQDFKKYNVRIKFFIFSDNIETYNQNFVPIDSNVIETVKSVQPNYKGTNIFSAVNYVLSTLPDNNESYKILLFTDLAEHILDTSVVVSTTSLPAVKKNADVVVLYPKCVDKNWFIKNVNISNEAEDLEISYTPVVVNSNDKEVNVKLVINNNVVDTRNVSFLSPVNKFVYSIDKNLTEKNIFGTILLPSDSLIEDNKFFFTHSFFGKQRKILCLINEPEYVKGFNSKKYYFEKLNVVNAEVKIKCVTEPDNIEQTLPDIEGYDLIILVGLNKIYFLENILQKINSCFIFPDENINIDDYENVLRGVEFIDLQSAGKYKEFTVLPLENEFGKLIQMFEYKNIKFYKKYLLTIKDTVRWEVLLNYSDNTPMVVRNNNLYLFSFSADKNWTNFLYKPFFVGLISYVLHKSDEVSNEIKIKNYYYVSEKIELKNIANVKTYFNEGENLNLYEKTYDGIKFYVPGVYEISTVDNKKYVVAINIPQQESNVVLAKKSDVKKIFAEVCKTQVNFFEVEEKNRTKILQWCFGKDISFNLIYLVVLCFIVETILSRLSDRII